MKISRNYLNKLVKLTWEDPCGGGERVLIEKALKGRHALAKWTEYGVIDDITDGVVRFRQSEAAAAGASTPDEAIFGWVPEDLILDCQVMVPEAHGDAI